MTISPAIWLSLGWAVLAALVFPLALMVWWHRRSGAPFRDALFGALTFFIAVFVLESLLHSLVLREGSYVYQHTWAYIAYAALAAGVFEETGRFLAFTFLFKKQSGNAVGLMYGIGHGGIEAILLVGVNTVVSLVMGLAGSTDLAAVPAGMLALGGLERIAAICLQIALSMLVFWAVKRPGKRWLYPLAILLHAGLDAFAVQYQLGIWTSLPLLEGFVAVYTLIVAVCVARAWPKLEAPAPQAEAE